MSSTQGEESAKRPSSNHFWRDTRMLMAAWSMVILLSLGFNIHQQREYQENQFLNEAKAFHATDMAYRSWIINHGGVYVPVSEETQPSPYLAGVPERDVTTPSGRTLTLLNSAYAIRQVHDILDSQFGEAIHSHIASINPINPVNQADDWEIKALKQLEQGKEEVSEASALIDGNPFFRYMRPMVMDESCMKCHAAFGAKPGDVHGGISVSIPAKYSFAGEELGTGALLSGHGLIWVLGMFGLYIGGKRQRHAIQVIKRSEEEVKLLTNSIAHAIFGQDLKGRCTFANDACVQILGYEKEEELLGRDMHAIFHHSRADNSPYPAADCPILKTGRSGSTVHVETEVFWRKDGSHFPVDYWSYPIEKSGERLGVVVTFVDITANEQAKLQLKKSEKLLAKAQSIAHIGSWELDLVRDTLYWSDEIYRIFGLERESFAPSYEAFLNAIHPEDREAVNSAYTQSLEKRLPYAIEHRLLMKDGSIKYVHEQCETTFDADGKPLRSLGTVQDISERKQVEIALRKAKEQYDDLVNRIPVGIYLYHFFPDGSDRFDYISPQFCQLLGVTEAEVLENPRVAFSAAHPEDLDSLLQANTQAFESQQPFHWEGRFLVHGEVRWIKLESEPTLLPGGETLWNGVVINITQRKLAEGSLAHAHSALNALSTVNHELIHASAEKELLQAICKAIVEQKEYRMAWVGYLQQDDSKSINLIASAGDEQGILAHVTPSWSGEELGLCQIAVHSGKYQISKDILHDPRYQSWKELLSAHNCASSIALPLKESDKVFGILHVYSSEIDAFAEQEVQLLEEMSQDLAFGVASLRIRQERDKAMLENKEHLGQMHETLHQTVIAISRAVEARDPYTAGHQRRVADLACAIAGRLGLSEERIEGISMGATIHDIGKIQIPAEILTKPSNLSELEYGFIREHSRVGYEILHDIHFPWPVAEMAYQHHERLDGSGYPQGLKGDEICLEARIVAVADVVEAMSTHRPYRASLGIEKALEEINANRGKLYDAGVVDACLALFEEGYQLVS